VVADVTAAETMIAMRTRIFRRDKRIVRAKIGKSLERRMTGRTRDDERVAWWIRLLTT
jgi:hypothetical protein